MWQAPPAHCNALSRRQRDSAAGCGSCATPVPPRESSRAFTRRCRRARRPPAPAFRSCGMTPGARCAQLVGVERRRTPRARRSPATRPRARRRVISGTSVRDLRTPPPNAVATVHDAAAPFNGSASSADLLDDRGPTIWVNPQLLEPARPAAARDEPNSAAGGQDQRERRRAG